MIFSISSKNIKKIARLISRNDGSITGVTFCYEMILPYVCDHRIIINLSDYLRHPTLLLHAIQKNRTIQQVEFDKLFLHLDTTTYKDSQKIATLLGRILQLPALRELHISENIYFRLLEVCGDRKNLKCCEILWSTLYNSTNAALSTLSIHGCCLGTSMYHHRIGNSSNIRKTQQFFNSLALNFNSLKNLELSYNFIDDEECEMLCHALLIQRKKISCLKNLDLSHNNIGNRGCKALSKLLADNRIIALKSLMLNRNRIIDDGFQVLVTEGLNHNTTLQCLGISGNRIGINGATTLANALRMNKILTLNSIHNFQYDKIFGRLGQEIEFYLKLNKAGRRHFMYQNNDGNRINTKNWAFALKEVNDDIQCMYYFIWNYPEQCNIHY